MTDDAPTEQPSADAPREAPAPQMQQTHNVMVGDRVQLNGTLFNVASGVYDWHLVGPDGDEVPLTNPTMPGPSFVAEQAGSYTATLSTDDGEATITVNAAAGEGGVATSPGESVVVE